MQLLGRLRTSSSSRRSADVGLLEDLARAAMEGGFGTQAFSGPGYAAVWNQLKPWLARISTNGALRWIPRAGAQLPCQIPDYENGMPVGPCQHTAIEVCVLCSRPTCLTHAFVDAQGDMVCYLCVVEARAAKGHPPREQQPPWSRQEQAPPPPDPKVAARQKEWWARGILNVQAGVRWSDVKAQYKKLSAQHHPDKPGGNEQRFKDVQAAFEILKTVYGEN